MKKLLLSIMLCLSLISMAQVKPVSAITAATVKKNAIKKGWKKIEGGWYYFNKKKPYKGLKKVGTKYYYFNKIGTMQTGLQKISKKNYYFMVQSDGKAPMYTGKATIKGQLYYFKKVSGKSPAVVSKTAKIDGKTYYFTSKGYGFISTGNTKGNKAMEKVINNVTFKGNMTTDDKLEACYKYILKKVGYASKLKPEMTSTWYYTTAYNTISEGKGKCYHYAAITGVVAKALGYSTKVVVGQCTYRQKTYAEHSWVIVKKDSKWYVVDAVYEDTPTGYSSGDLKFFMNPYEKLADGCYQMKTDASVDVDPEAELTEKADITNYCYKETKRY